MSIINGKTATLRIPLRIFSAFTGIDLFYDSAYDAIDAFIVENLFCGIYEQDVCTPFEPDFVLESSPAFADASLEEIAFYCSLEQFFRHGNKQSGVFQTVIFEVDVTQSTFITVLSSGKKPFYASLAAQSFLFRKSIGCCRVHFSSWQDIIRVPLRQKVPPELVLKLR